MVPYLHCPLIFMLNCSQTSLTHKPSNVKGVRYGAIRGGREENRVTARTPPPVVFTTLNFTHLPRGFISKAKANPSLQKLRRI
jgi:hypothetical protein